MQACQFCIPIDCNQPHHNDFGALVTIVSLMIIKEKIVENSECVFMILSRCFEAQVMSRHKGEPTCFLTFMVPQALGASCKSL
jgi:hypothetical protein